MFSKKKEKEKKPVCSHPRIYLLHLHIIANVRRHRSSHSQMFFKICVLHTFRPATLLKRDSNAGVFL